MMGDIRSELHKPDVDRNVLADMLEHQPQEVRDYALRVGGFHRERWLAVKGAYESEDPATANVAGPAWNVIMHALCDLTEWLCADVGMRQEYHGAIDAVRGYVDACGTDGEDAAGDRLRKAAQGSELYSLGGGNRRIWTRWAMKDLLALRRGNVPVYLTDARLGPRPRGPLGSTTALRRLCLLGINQYVRECLLHYVRTGEVRR